MSDLRYSTDSFTRGSVWYIDLEEGRVGSEQMGKRPAVIISNDKNNKFSETVNVVVATSKPKNYLPVHVEAYLHRESIFLCEHIVTISKSRLQSYIGKLSEMKMEEIEDAILIQLGVCL